MVLVIVVDGDSDSDGDRRCSILVFSGSVSASFYQHIQCSQQASGISQSRSR